MTDSGAARQSEAVEAASGRAVLLAATGCVVPDVCACCGDSAPSSRLEVSHRDGQSLIVPYCTRCLRHASAGTTRSLAAVVASCLLASTVALALPLAWPSSSLLAHVAVTLLAATIPLVVRWAVARRAVPGHSSAERAVWWQADGALVCTSPKWAESLARGAESAEVRPMVAREPRFAAWAAAGPILALVAGPTGWYVHHPLVRVLNLTENRVTVLLDGRAVVDVDPTSSESPAAGVEVRLPTGPHRLSARGPDGELVAEVHATLRSGARHLYAPGSDAYCFWLEETHYGRAGSEPARIDRLEGSGHVWVLPRRIDTWFSPNPPPGAADARSSGGVLVALRQSRCDLAPAAVRR